MQFRKYRKLFNVIGYAMMVIASQTGCNKMVEIPAPYNTITTTEVFNDSADANSAVNAIYSNMINTGGVMFGSGALTIYCGASADELLPFQAGNADYQFSSNTLESTNPYISAYFWNQPYQFIYQINAIIDGINSSSGLSQANKRQFIAEAKFFRAFLNFYLTNMFGDVPLVTSIDFKSNALLSRKSANVVYDSIISDLKVAESDLSGDYSLGKGERVRVNKYAATAMLARVYLYTGQWSNAESEASKVIGNTSMYSLAPDPNNVFLKGSSEAIFQLQIDPSLNTGIYNATPEGFALVPYSSDYNPYYYVTPQLLSAFEPGDQRMAKWLDSTNFFGTVYYYPYKYKIGPAQMGPGTDATEYYMVLRLAEQFLIRAEAKAEQNTDLPGAIADLNVIRERAGLTDLPTNLDQTAILAAVQQERRIELFAEWGNRWFDLKRTAKANVVLGAIKSKWESYQQLYPIPQAERQVDPNLTQNTGY